MKKSIFILLSVFFFVTSCTTYDYGPHFSLYSATTRLVGEWKLEQVLVDDSDNIMLFEEEKDFVLHFYENGDFIKSYSGPARNDFLLKGNWEFDEEKKLILLNTSESLEKSIYVDEKIEILKLTKTEFWTLEQNINRNSGVSIERRYSKISE
jgi:hypothetical protein